MAPLEWNAAAVEIVRCVALVLGAVLFVVGNRVVGILLVTRIRLLRRRVDADADDLLARMAHAEIRMQQTTLSLGEEPEPAQPIALRRAKDRSAAPVAAGDTETARSARVRFPRRAPSTDARARRTRARRTTGCARFRYSINPGDHGPCRRTHSSSSARECGDVWSRCESASNPMWSGTWLTPKRRTRTPLTRSDPSEYSFFQVR